MAFSPFSYCCGSCCGPCCGGKFAGIVRRDDIRNPAIFEKDAIEDPVIPSHNCCVDFTDSIDINVGNRLKCCMQTSILCIGVLICPCIYCIACCNAWKTQEDRLKETYWSSKSQYIRSNAKYLDKEIIRNWVEYERMFENIAWKGYLGMIDATATNSISNPRHYALINAIYFYISYNCFYTNI